MRKGVRGGVGGVLGLMVLKGEGDRGGRGVWGGILWRGDRKGEVGRGRWYLVAWLLRAVFVIVVEVPFDYFRWIEWVVWGEGGGEYFVVNWGGNIGDGNYRYRGSVGEGLGEISR